MGGRPRPDEAGAFIMNEEGVARLFSTHLNDGPFSEHYEPVESPTGNPLHEAAPLTTLGFAKHLGAYLLSFSVVGALVHLLAFGQEKVDE